MNTFTNQEFSMNRKLISRKKELNYTVLNSRISLKYLLTYQEIKLQVRSMPFNFQIQKLTVKFKIRNLGTIWQHSLSSVFNFQRREQKQIFTYSQRTYGV